MHRVASYSEATKQTRVGILPRDYPKTELTTTLLGLLEESILGTVIKQRREAFKPKFTNCQYKAGFMVINCQDRCTAEWLKKIVPTLKPWENADLKAVDEEQIPRPEVLIAFCPKSAFNDNDTILALIESQNELRTDAWRVLHRRGISQQHVELAFSVDEASMQRLVRANLLINYKFGQIQLRRSGPNRHSGNKKPREDQLCEEAVRSIEAGANRVVVTPSGSHEARHSKTGSAALPNETEQSKPSNTVEYKEAKQKAKPASHAQNTERSIEREPVKPIDKRGGKI